MEEDTYPDAEAEFELAKSLKEQGRPNEAEGHYRRAAEAGHPKAMSSLGVLLVERDEGEAERWWRKAAEAGANVAMFNLAVMLEVRPDSLEEAKRWFKAAAEAGHPRAAARLKEIIHGGPGGRPYLPGTF